jgi:hypothetical protein
MHLLSFAPNFLPDHSSVSESILDESIDKGGDQWQQLSKLLEGSNDLESRCKQLWEINTGDGDVCEAPLLVQGAHCHVLGDRPTCDTPSVTFSLSSLYLFSCRVCCLFFVSVRESVISASLVKQSACSGLLDARVALVVITTVMIQ